MVFYVPQGGEKMSITKRGKHSYRFECSVNKVRFRETFNLPNQTEKEIKKIYEGWKNDCVNKRLAKSKYTLKEFGEIWVNQYCATYSPLVIRSYKANLNNWIYPELGNYNLDDITPIVVDKFINLLKTSTTKYKTRKNEPLSNGSIKAIYKVLRAIITMAYRKELINANPCSRVKLELKREIAPNKPHYWDANTYKYALSLLEKENTENSIVVEFALKTGLRRSEMFGITWQDVDLINNIVSINKTRQKVKGNMIVLPCKTLSSVREIVIPNSLSDKLRTIEHTSKYVFGDVDCDCVTSWYRDWVKKNNLPPIRFHDLRHTHATLLLYKGIDIKTISERLGHSNIGTTMNTYTHVMKELDKKCAIALDSI